MNKIVSLFAGIGLLAMGCASGADVAETESVGVDQAAASGVTATLSYPADWGGGFCANVSVTNALSQATPRWQVVLDLKTTTVSGFWNAAMSGTTGKVTVTPADYNTNIPAGGTVNFGFCANAPSASVRPVLSAWNMESTAYATCPTNNGVNPTKAALAVAMATELGRWTPATDLAISNGKVVLSAAALSKCGSAGCANTKAILGQQDFTMDQTVFNPTNFSQELQSGFTRQATLIDDLTRNNPSKLPPNHKLTLVGGPTNLGLGSCGPHYVYQVDNSDGSPLSTTQATNMANALCFYGQGNCGNNTYIGFTQTSTQCPSGRTCVAIDPTDGDNGSASTTTAGSAPSYPLNRVFDPLNMLLGTSCITTAGKLGGIISKCATSPSTCGYLYCSVI
ncbi:MAG: cellulose binding domain-containing protein [Polyangiaceae bacterium]